MSSRNKHKPLSRRDFLKFSGTALGAVALAGCARELDPAPTATPLAVATATPDVPMVAEVIIGEGVPITELDPHKHPATVEESVLRNMYDCLVVLSADATSVEPQLATEWSQIDDVTLQLRLREGVKFHNGEDFDAEAVRYSFHRFADPDTGAPYVSSYDSIDRVDIVDQYTVNVVTNRPDPVLLRRLATFHTKIVPPRHFSTATPEELGSTAVGTGPYRLVTFERDADLVMEVNPDYWGEAPQITKLTMRAIPETGARIAALLAGDVDIITAVPPDDVDRVDASDHARVLAQPGNRVVFFYLPLDIEPLQDPLVRQALNYGANIDGVIRSVLGGSGYRRATYLNPWYPCYNPDVAPYPYDPEKAKALLEDAGLGDGFGMNMYLSIGRVAKDTEFGEAVAGELAKIGVNVNPIPLEWGTFVSMNVAGELDGCWIASWGNFLHDPDGSLFTQLHSSTVQTSSFSGGYENPELDVLLEEARFTLDKDERCELYTQAQRIAMEDPPAIFGYAIENAYGVSNRIQWEPRPDEMIWGKEMRVAT